VGRVGTQPQQTQTQMSTIAVVTRVALIHLAPEFTGVGVAVVGGIIRGIHDRAVQLSSRVKATTVNRWAETVGW